MKKTAEHRETFYLKLRDLKKTGKLELSLTENNGATQIIVTTPNNTYKIQDDKDSLVAMRDIYKTYFGGDIFQVKENIDSRELGSWFDSTEQEFVYNKN